MSEDILDSLEHLRDQLIRACNMINQMRFEERKKRQGRPPLDPPAAASLTEILATADEHQASELYSHFPGESRAVARAVQQLGWHRVRREKGIFWIRPTDSVG